MKKYLPIIFVLLFAVSCTNNPANSDSQSENSSGESISASSTDEKPSVSEGSASSSEKPGSGSSSEKDTTLLSDISDIKNVGQDYASKVDADGYYVSDVLAEFNAQLLMVEDYISAAGQKAQYTAFVANETGYISVLLAYEKGYETLKKYVDEQQVYKIKGYVAYMDGQVAVDTRTVANPQHLAGVSLNYDYRLFAENGGTITNLVDRINEKKFNVKGVSASAKLYKYTLKYLMKVENTIALFSDGTKIIMAHGHDKINNSLREGFVYDVYGREGYHQFRPQIKLIGVVTNSSATIDFDYKANAEAMSGAKLYTYKYEKDKNAYISSNMDYAALFVKVFKFSGYVNYYQKDGKFSYVLDDSAKNKSYDTYTNAYSAKTLFLNNNGYVNETGAEITSRDLFSYAPGGEFAGVKIDLYFVAYMWNTNHYWQIQLFLDSIPVR